MNKYLPKMNNSQLLYHHGIKGQKWGVRRYQNPDGSLTSAGEKRYNKALEFNIKRAERQRDFSASQSELYKKQHEILSSEKYKKRWVKSKLITESDYEKNKSMAKAGLDYHSSEVKRLDSRIKEYKSNNYTNEQKMRIIKDYKDQSRKEKIAIAGLAATYALMAGEIAYIHYKG